jgi:hypothetical protein
VLAVAVGRVVASAAHGCLRDCPYGGVPVVRRLRGDLLLARASQCLDSACTNGRGSAEGQRLHGVGTPGGDRGADGGLRTPHPNHQVGVMFGGCNERREAQAAVRQSSLVCGAPNPPPRRGKQRSQHVIRCRMKSLLELVQQPPAMSRRGWQLLGGRRRGAWRAAMAVLSLPTLAGLASTVIFAVSTDCQRVSRRQPPAPAKGRAKSFYQRSSSAASARGRHRGNVPPRQHTPVRDQVVRGAQDDRARGGRLPGQRAGRCSPSSSMTSTRPAQN